MTSKDQRITDIINKRDSLTLEANTLTQELRNLQEQDSIVEHNHGFKLGDSVVISNGYQGLRGTKGIVTHITTTQVTFQCRTGKTHRRKYTIVRKTGYEEYEYHRKCRH
jgi:hypothetical protein